MELTEQVHNGNWSFLVALNLKIKWASRQWDDLTCVVAALCWAPLVFCEQEGRLRCDATVGPTQACGLPVARGVDSCVEQVGFASAERACLLSSGGHFFLLRPALWVSSRMQSGGLHWGQPR